MPSKRTPIGLSPQAVRRVRRVTVAAVALLALMAAVLSFDGLQALAVTAGFDPRLAWLLPLVIDGLVVVGSLGVITATLVGTTTWYFWLLTLLGVVASVVGNVAAAPPNLLAQAVHAVPPLVFALAVEGLLAVYRASAEATPTQAADTATDSPEATTPTNTAPVASRPVESAEAPSLTTGEATSQAATTPARGPDTTPPSEAAGTARERLRLLLADQPDITGGQAAAALGIDPSHARRLLREERAAQPITTP